MKRSVLLVSAAFLLLHPFLPARAAEPVSVECRRLYAAWDQGQISPISSYTQAVLERTRAGMTHAGTLPVQSDFVGYLPDWARHVQSTWAQLLDAQLQVRVQQASLLSTSACLHFDQLLIACAMEEVRLTLHDQFARGSIPGIEAMQSLLVFLHERLLHLSRGALDPLYADPSVSARYRFDPPVVDGDVADMTNVSPFCPYHSDYAPAFPSGYGCDLFVLEPRTTFAPLRAEWEAQRIIEAQIAAQQTQAAFVQDQWDTAAGGTGSVSPLSNALTERPHRTAFGCSRNGGICLDDRTVSCVNDAACIAAGAGSVCVIPVAVCSDNRIIRCLDDGDCAGAGLCVVDDEALPSARSLRGTFSLDPDELQMLMDFLDVRTQQELVRSFGSQVMFADEFPDGSTEQADRMREDRNPLTRGLRESLREFLRKISRDQSVQEASFFARTVDAQRHIAASLAPLQESVGRIARLAHDPDGLRDFVVRYATFLRRTCIHRPCNALLDRILKIAFADACFPYTDGDFLTDTPSNPRWQQCQDALQRQ